MQGKSAWQSDFGYPADEDAGLSKTSTYTNRQPTDRESLE